MRSSFKTLLLLYHLLLIGNSLIFTCTIFILAAQTISGVAGTGPYIYDEYVAGEYTRFVRNEDYWGETPYWDEIIVKYIPDSTSRLQALQTGEIDMIYGGTLLTYEEYDQALAMDGIDGGIVKKTVHP